MGVRRLGGAARWRGEKWGESFREEADEARKVLTSLEEEETTGAVSQAGSAWEAANELKQRRSRLAGQAAQW